MDRLIARRLRDRQSFRSRLLSLGMLTEQVISVGHHVVGTGLGRFVSGGLPKWNRLLNLLNSFGSGLFCLLEEKLIRAFKQLFTFDTSFVALSSRTRFLENDGVLAFQSKLIW